VYNPTRFNHLAKRLAWLTMEGGPNRRALGENRLLYEAFGRAASAIAVKSAADEPDYLSGITISRSLVATTNMASSFAGAVVLAFWLIW